MSLRYCLLKALWIIHYRVVEEIPLMLSMWMSLPGTNPARSRPIPGTNYEHISQLPSPQPCPPNQVNVDSYQ